jgi:hypothetical protein
MVSMESNTSSNPAALMAFFSPSRTGVHRLHLGSCFLSGYMLLHKADADKMGAGLAVRNQPG